MSEKIKGTHLNDEELEKMLIGLYQMTDQGGCHKRFFDAVREIRDMAYSIGYRHGHEDKVNKRSYGV